jgi:hypothetical protein
MKGTKRGENIGISKFILDIGEKIEEVSGAKLNFSQEATVPKEKWIPKKQEKMKLKSVQLRTEEQTQNLDVVELKKFDPYCLQGNSEITCRVPGFLQTTSRRSKKRRTKQDLFLCKAHRENLTDLISKCCAKENVDVTSFKNSNDFEGYTSLIGALEKAFMRLKSKRLTTTTDALLAEVFLNTRNFLIITNALLNPDEGNTTTVLGPYLTILWRYLEDPATLQNSVVLLVVVMYPVYQFYGIIYQWVHVPLENPGAEIGFGVGILFVILVTLVSDDVPFWLKSLSCLFFPFAMSLICSGAYDWNTGRDVIGRMREQNARIHGQFISAIRPDISQFVALANAVGNISLITTEQN